MGSFDQKRRPQDMWPPITVATPHGTGGARLTAGKRTYKNGVHFFPLNLPRLYIFFALHAFTSQLHEFDLVGPDSPLPIQPLHTGRWLKRPL